MEEVLNFLALKNHYYEKFYNVTLKFIEMANENCWDSLEFFVDSRERILNIIRTFDHKISREFQTLNLSESELSLYKERVNELMKVRANIATKIVSADLELITKMDEVKIETINELKRTVETGQQIGSFSSTRKPTKQRKDI